MVESYPNTVIDGLVFHRLSRCVFFPERKKEPGNILNNNSGKAMIKKKIAKFKKISPQCKIK